MLDANLPGAYPQIGQFHIGALASGAGLEIDCEGNLWAVDQSNEMIYQAESGESASLCSPDTVPWFAEDPISGTVAPGGSLGINVGWWANVAEADQPGTYHAGLKIKSNDPDNQNLVLPVTMTVTPPATWGKLTGIVSSTGHCDVNPHPIEGAQVYLEGSSGYTCTLETDAEGAYQRWLDSTESPYIVTVSSPEHPTTAASVAIVAGATTTQDFMLRWQQPCVSVTVPPAGISATLDMGLSATFPMSISNSGAISLEFELQERNRGFQIAALLEGAIIWLTRSTEGIPVAASDSGSTVAYPGSYRYVPATSGPTAVNILVYTDDWIHPTPNTLVQQAIARLGLPATVHIDGDYAGFETDLITGDPWDLVIWSGENAPVPASTLTALLTYLQNGGKLAATYWRQLNIPTDPLWAEMGFTYIENYVVPPPAYWWDPGHPIFNDPESAPEWINRVQNSGTSQGTKLEPLTNGVAVAGYTITPAPNEAGIVIRDDDMAVYKGLRDVSTDIDDDGDSVLDGVELWENIITGLLYGFGGDVPWLFEDPITGTVSADGGLAPIDVTLDAAYVAQPGEYYATLSVKSNDPVNSRVGVPVTMTVNVPPTWGKLEGTVTSLGHCDANPAPLEEAEVLIENGTTVSVTTDVSGTYAYWLDEGTYTVTISADEHISDTAVVNVTAGTTTTQDFDLRWLQPCVSVTPAGISATLDMGLSTTLPMSISNSGATVLEFEIGEANRGFVPLIATFRPLAPPPDYAGLNSDQASEFPVVPTAPWQLLGTGALLIQDSAAWGYNAIETILTNNGIPYDVINSSQIATTNFTPYRMIIIPSVQGSTYNATFNANLTKFEDFVDAGGLVIMSFCEQSSHVPYCAIPFGGTNNYGTASDNYIVDPGHPIFAGVSNPYWGSSASHSYLTDLLPGDRVLVTAGTGPGGNVVMIERDHGAGMLVAGGQTFEFGWGNGQGAGIILENMIPHYYFNWVGGGDALWLSEDPITGTVPADGGLVPIDVTLDAAYVAQPGEYYATLNVNSDDPVNSRIGIPVTMTVNLPATYGKLQGIVTSLGYCDVNPTPLEGAEVLIEGHPLTLTTDISGTYVLWLDQGTYTVTVSYAEHLTDTTVVDVTAQATTTHNVALRWLQPCISVAPASITATLEMGLSTTLPVSISNSGAVNLEFALQEEDHGFSPLGSVALGGHLSGGTILWDTSHGVYLGYSPSDRFSNLKNDLESRGYIVDENDSGVLNLDLSGYTAIVVNLGSAWDSPYSTTEAAAIQAYVNSGGGLIAMGDNTNCPNANITPVVQLFGATTGIGAIDNIISDLDAHPIFSGVSSLYFIAAGALGASAPSQAVGRDSSGRIGVTVAHYGAGRVIVIGDVSLWANDYIDGNDIDVTTGGSDATGGGIASADNRVFAVNTFDWATYGSGDVPWLSEDPVAGTVPADGGLVPIDVTLDAARVAQPGEYYATLNIKSNDPYSDSIGIPVTMTVEPDPDMGKLGGTVTADRPAGPLEGALAEVISGTTTVISGTTDGSGGYGPWWLTNGTYSITVSAMGYFPDEQTVTITAGVTTTHDVVLLSSYVLGAVAYVTLSDSNLVALVDTASHTVMGTVNVEAVGCYFPWRATLSPSGDYVYVGCRDSDNVAVIETAGSTVVTTVGGIPSADGIAFTRDGAYALVGSRWSNQIAVVDTTTYAVTTFIPTPDDARSIVTHPYLDIAYATCANGTIQVIDTTDFSIVEAIPVGSEPWDVALSPDGRWVFVSDRRGAGLAVIAAGSNTVHTTVTGLGNLQGLAVTPDGSRIYAADRWGDVRVIDGATFNYLTSIPGTGNGWDVAVTCDGSELYVTRGRSGDQVPVVDTATSVVTDTINMPGSGPRGIAVCPQFRLPGLYLYPTAQSGYETPGESVVYGEFLVNGTGQTDSFDLARSGNAWDTGLSLANTGPLSDGAWISFTVQVTIPVSASAGDGDTALIQATSVTSPTVYSDTATITTTAICTPNLTFAGQSAWTTRLDDTYDYGGQLFTRVYLYAHTTSGGNSIVATVSGYNAGAGMWETIGEWRYVGSQLLVDGWYVPPVYSQIRVELRDNWGAQVYYDYQFIICREPAVGLSPSSQQRFAQPGTTAVYTQTVTNYMMATDSFDLSASGNSWPTTLWDGATPVSNTGPLADLETFTFTVKVEVPASASMGDSDAATICARSVAFPAISDTASLRTAVLAYPWVQAFSDYWAPDSSTDREQYLDIVRSSGVVTAQVTDDGDWQGSPPAVAAYPCDAIVAAWTSPSRWNGTAWYRNVEYAAFDADGNTVISVTQVSDNISATIRTYDYNPAPAVAPSDGNVLIAWYRQEGDWPDYRSNIYYAVRSPAGTEVLSPTALTTNTTSTVRDYYSSAAAFGDGRFAVAWQHWDDATGATDVYYAVLDSMGGLITGPVNLTHNTWGDDYSPRANRLADGSVLLTWYGDHGSGREIYYAVLDSAGTVVYPVTRLTDVPHDAYRPDAVGLRNGNTVVAWEQYGYYPNWGRQIVYAVLDSAYNTSQNPGEMPWTARYYNNDTLTEPAALVRTDNTINFQWGTGSPDPTVNTDHFSVRWTGTITLTAGTYQFNMGSDDGSRLWIDGQLVMDHWDECCTYWQATVPLTDGPHQVKMEMHEHEGAAWAELTWQAILANTLANDNYYVSLARDRDDNAVFTWRDDSRQHVYYGLVDNSGAVRTWPMVFRTARGRELDISWWGAGNGSLPLPLLTLDKAAAPDPVQAGGLLTYTIVVSNTGSADATGVVITDAIPTNTAFVSADLGGSEVGDEVRWTGKTVSAGGSLTVTFVVTVTSPLPDGTIIANADYGVICAEGASAIGSPVTTTVQSAPVISEVRVTNIRDTASNVSWVTNQSATGEVHYGTDPANLDQTAYDDRGAGTFDDTHYATLTGLTPETTYYFDVVSGSTTDDNDGAHYTVTTGPTLGLPPSDQIFGQVFEEDGTTLAEGTIVYITLRDEDGDGSSGEAAPMSALVDEYGWWYANLGNARTADLSGYFDYSASGDWVLLKSQGAADGVGCLAVYTAEDTPATPIVLNVSRCTWAINIQIGWNHISLPLVPIIPYTAEGVCSEINDQGGDVAEIDRWYASGWDGHICGLPFNDFDVELGSDYFIRSNAVSTWTIEGYEVTTGVPLELQVGWNSIGIPHTDAYTAESLCDDINDQCGGGTAVEVDRWYASGWDGHICGLPFNDFDIEIGKGYFVKAGSACTVTPGLAATSLAAASPLAMPKLVEAPQAARKTKATITEVKVTNVRDTSFTVSWSTDVIATGWVNYGTSPALGQIAYDDRGAKAIGESHHVTLQGLSPQTTYYFEVVSGATVDDQKGSCYQVATGWMLGLPTSDSIYGQVFERDGVTPAEGAIIYVTLRDADGVGSSGEAGVMSALVNGDGWWHANLGNARLADGSGYFAYSAVGDAVVLVAQGAAGGFVSRTVDTDDLRPAAPLTLVRRRRAYLPLVVKE